MEPQIELRLEVIPDEPTDAETKQALLEAEWESLVKAANEMRMKPGFLEAPSRD